ncbi:MAG: twin-arginine translocation signal domain-containing protein, partial [Thermogemmata sp.]
MTMTFAEETRREFLHDSLTAAAAATLGAGSILAAQDQQPGEGLPRRPLGRTGVRVSILCLGGWHIGDIRDKKEAIRI